VAGDPKTYTQDEIDAMIASKLDEATAGLKKNRDDALREAKDAKTKLQNYEGVDPDEFKRLKDAAAEAERKKAAAEGDFKALEKQLIERHSAERQGDAKKIEKLTKALERRLVDARLAEMLAKHEADPSMLPLLQLEGRRYVRVKETDDDFEEYVTDEAGKGPLISDGKGTPMNVDDLVGQVLKTKYPAAFRGTGSSGGGATKSRGGAGGTTFNPASNDGQAFLAQLESIAKS